MNGTRQFFEAFRSLAPNPYFDFMLANGRDYQTGPDTYAGPRGVRHQCFMNATMLATNNPALTYVEGKVVCCGVPLDHAWCVDTDGIVVDPTLRGAKNITGYFGVPFKTSYVMRAVMWNKVYGVLDFYFAKKTAPKLFELGLEAGQQWLLDQWLLGWPKRKSSK